MPEINHASIMAAVGATMPTDYIADSSFFDLLGTVTPGQRVQVNIRPAIRSLR